MSAQWTPDPRERRASRCTLGQWVLFVAPFGTSWDVCALHVPTGAVESVYSFQGDETAARARAVALTTEANPTGPRQDGDRLDLAVHVIRRALSPEATR